MTRRGTFGEGRPTGMAEPGKNRVAGQQIGELLVAAGNITPEQLEEALLVQRKDQREMGKILLSMGYISEVELARVLARRLGLEYVDLTERSVDRGAAGLVDQRVLRKHGVMPLRLEGGCLIVATSNPTDFYALEDVTILSGHPVRPVVAAESEIRRVHDKVLAIGDEVAEMLKEAAEEPGEDTQGDLELVGPRGRTTRPSCAS